MSFQVLPLSLGPPAKWAVCGCGSAGDDVDADGPQVLWWDTSDRRAHWDSSQQTHAQSDTIRVRRSPQQYSIYIGTVTPQHTTVPVLLASVLISLAYAYAHVRVSCPCRERLLRLCTPHTYSHSLTHSLSRGAPRPVRAPP